MHQVVLINEERVRRGISQDSLCPRCHSAPETLMHVLRNREVVQEFWNLCIDPSCWSSFFSMGKYQWMNWNLSTKKMNRPLGDWPLFFCVAVWALWKDRNSLVFSSTTRLHSTFWYEVNSHVHIINKELHSPGNLFKDYRDGWKLVWHKPPEGWANVNTDGSFKSFAGSFSCGGLIRSDSSVFIKGFWSKINPCNALWTELCGFLQGIKLAKSLDLKQVTFEVYSQVLFDMLNKGITPLRLSNLCSKRLLLSFRIMPRRLQSPWLIMKQIYVQIYACQQRSECCVLFRNY